MKIAVVNGNNRHGSTWHCMDLVKQELEKYEEIQTTEFFLPRDMPHFCNGCFSCLMNGEHTCPHFESVAPIATALLDADLIILTSPIYAMDISGQLKALLDHLCYMWFSHRPNPRMFNKVGLIITTTAGAGLGHAAKTIHNTMKFWGVKRIFVHKNAVAAMKWGDVSVKKQKQIQKRTAVMAKRIAKAIKKVDRLTVPLFSRVFFKMMTGMMKKNTWNPCDRKHWEDQGWLSGASPF